MKKNKITALFLLTIGISLSSSCQNLAPIHSVSHAASRPNQVVPQQRHQNTPTDVEIIESFSYYNIEPTSIGDLVPSLLQATPIKRNGKQFLAETLIAYEWTLDWLTDKRRCWVNQARVEFRVNLLLPKLLAGPSELSDLWSTWFPKLLAHELHHKQIGVTIARKMLTQLNTLPSESNCEQLLANARAVVAALEHEARSLQQQYDEETKHGETEGLTSILQLSYCTRTGEQGFLTHTCQPIPANRFGDYRQCRYVAPVNVANVNLMYAGPSRLFAST